MTDEITLTLNNPLTDEQWDAISDVDFDRTDRIWFSTKHGKEVEFAKVVRCKDCKHRDPEDKKCDSGHGIVWQLPRPDDWYCADGERRTE